MALDFCNDKRRTLKFSKQVMKIFVLLCVVE